MSADDFPSGPQGHAKLAPSASERWRTCAGYPAAVAHLAREESPDAQRGTRLHEIAHRLLAGFPGAADIRDLAPEDAEAIDDALAAFRLLRAETRAEPVAFEQKVNTSIHPECWGTLDCALWAPDSETLVISDWKFGYQYVDPTDWPQGMLYADGALTSGLTPPPQRILLAVIQPARSPYANVHEISPWELDVFRLDMRDAARRAMLPGAPRTAGPHCQWCPVRGVCPTLGAALLDMLPADPEAAAANASPAQLAYWLDKAPLVQSWLSAVMDRATAAARAGDPPPGWKLVQGAGRSRLDDTRGLGEKLLARGYSPEQLFNFELKWTVGQLRKLAASLVWDEADDLLTHIVRPASAPELVRDRDPRPAVAGDRDLDLLPVNDDWGGD